MSEIKKTIRVYTKDNFNFTGKLILINEHFLQILDYKTNNEMTFPILNVARIEEVKDREVEKNEKNI